MEDINFEHYKTCALGFSIQDFLIKLQSFQHDAPESS